MENTDKIIKEYLLNKGAYFSRKDDMYCVRWTRDSSAFAEGWTIEAVEDDMMDNVILTVGYHIKGVDDDSLADAMWGDVKGMYPGVSFMGYSLVKALRGEVHLSMSDVLDDQSDDLVGCLESAILTLAEAVFSLMARYDKEYYGLDGNDCMHVTRYSGFAKSTFVHNCIPDARHRDRGVAAERPGRATWNGGVSRPVGFDSDYDPFAAGPEPDLPAVSGMGLKRGQRDFAFQRPEPPSPERGNAPFGFAAIAGMDSLKNELGRKVLWPLTHKEEAGKYRVHMPSGMLLYGPPGCGKTYFAERFAEECGYAYRLVRPSDLGSRFMHGSQELISRLFEEARDNSPCVVCLDEIDAMVPSRGSLSGEQRAEEVNEFLSQLNDAGNEGVFVVGTTNRRDLMDQAALRSGRFDIQVEIPAPDTEMRTALFTFEMEGRPLAGDIDISVLAAKTDGYACSDIVKIVNDAALDAAIGEEPISQKHLDAAVAATESSLKGENKKPRIGFGTELQKPSAIGF